MKIRVYSDIHNEIPRPGGIFSITSDYDDKNTILIIAGDLDTLKNMKKTNGLDYIKSLCDRFKDVIYVFGNHEYYSGKIGSHYDYKNIQIFDGISNLHILSRFTKSVIIDDICFIGATLWSHLGEFDVVNSRNENSSNDFKYIKQVVGNNFSSLKKNFFNMEHYKDFAWIKDQCEKYKNMKKVIVTHYPPINVLDPEDINGYYKNFYCSDLSAQIEKFENIKMWIFGHVHFDNSYEDNVSGIDFFCNPVGYYRSSDDLNISKKNV